MLPSVVLNVSEYEFHAVVQSVFENKPVKSSATIAHADIVFAGDTPQSVLRADKWLVDVKFAWSFPSGQADAHARTLHVSVRERVMSCQAEWEDKWALLVT